MNQTSQMLKTYLPYIPFGVTVRWFREEDNTWVDSLLTISDYDFLIRKKKGKPLLVPLSALKTLSPNQLQELFGLEDITDSSSIFNFISMYDSPIGNTFRRISADVYHKLLAHFFDVGDLINQNLAFNKLEK